MKTGAAASRARGAHAGVGLLLVLGTLALAARTVSPAALWITGAVGLLGLGVPVTGGARGGAGRWAAVTGAGMAAFLLVRLLWSGPGLPFTWLALAGNAAAGVAEEAFFRRGMYGWLERRGAPVAVTVTTVAFALVHIPVYGWGSVPLNLAAGALLGWQRWATGRWTAAAATHAAANVVQIVG